MGGRYCVAEDAAAVDGRRGGERCAGPAPARTAETTLTCVPSVGSSRSLIIPLTIPDRSSCPELRKARRATRGLTTSWTAHSVVRLGHRPLDGSEEQ